MSGEYLSKRLGPGVTNLRTNAVAKRARRWFLAKALHKELVDPWTAAKDRPLLQDFLALAGAIRLSYFATTDDVATPPRLLRTVMFCGFEEALNSPRY